MIDIHALTPEFLQNASILCIGDVMLDRYLYGTVDRISPEAPVPIVRIHQETEMLGGSGNVIRNISALQGQAHFISTIAPDRPGQAIKHLLSNLPGVTCNLHVLNRGETTVKTRVIAEKQQILRTDQENPHSITDHDRDTIYAWAEKAIKKVKGVILSDYGKGVLNASLNQRLITLAKNHNLPIFIDPKSPNFSDYKGATFITPNLKEFHHATQSQAVSDQEIDDHAQRLMAQHHIDNLLITRSQDGMSLIQSQDTRACHIPTHAQEVFDVSGAGDTVIATFAMAIGCGFSAVQAATIANTAASVVIGKLGAATVTPAELLQAFKHGSQSGALSAQPSIYSSWEDALAMILRWRSQGSVIGFTNGCFDIVHPGHISLLQQAKANCDRLIIGLNTDESVKRLKGSKRPINTAESRAEILCNLRMVDMVVLFNQDTPKELIAHIKPDVLVKGADYPMDQIIGAQDVLSWGGKVFRASLVPGHSTSNIITRSQLEDSK